MEDIFHFVAKPYKLRNDSTLQRKRDSTVCYGSEELFDSDYDPQEYGNSYQTL